MSAVTQGHVVEAMIETHGVEGGALVNDAVKAGVPWSAILMTIITHVGPALVDALKALIAQFTPPSPPPAT